MSNSVETRIVEMRFDNAQFEAGVKQTLASLQALEKGMKLDGAGKGLSSVAKGMGDVNAQASKFSLGTIGNAVESVKASFSSMQAIALGALASVGAKAVQAGTQIARGLFGPIKDGLGEYETNLNAIQTILANTQSSGAKLKDVNAALNDLNRYSDKTIYNFSEMAKNIGTFTAAGVDLKTATGSIKGIANLAALSGSNSQQASTAMYQLSQAISAGRVSLQDWNSVVNAGMGGTVFQRALAQNAVAMGKLKDSAVKLTGPMKNVSIQGKSFRESIQAGPGKASWLTSDVLTRTLEQFTGDLTDAQLKAQGFSEAQIKAIQLQAKTAQDAATKVKTMSQLFGTLSETAGSGWAQTWQIIFGDFEEAKTLWTSVNNVLSGFINASSNARNTVLGDWKALGGRTNLINAIRIAFHELVAIVKTVKDAFRDIFPAVTGAQLAAITQNLRMFVQMTYISADTLANLKRTAAGVFAVFDIGWQIIKKVVGVIVDLFSAASSGDGSFLKTTAGIGDFLVALDKAIKNGEGLTKFFDTLSSILQKPVRAIRALADAFFGLFSGVDAGSLDTLQNKLKPLGDIGSFIATVWGKVLSIFDDVIKAFGPLAQKFEAFFSGFASTIEGAFGNLDFSQVIDVLNTGLLTAAVVIFKKFTDNIGSGVDVMGSWKDKITGPFTALTNTLGEMQKTLRATTLLQIALAVGVLAASTVALSKVDAAGLTRALTAMTVMFTQLVGAMALFQKINIGKGMGQLILMAGAIRVLTSAVTALAKLSWADLMKGLSGVTILLGTVSAAALAMPDGKKMTSASAGLILMAAAIRILVGAVSELGGMSWESLAKGLTSVGVLLGSLALFTRLAATDKGGLLAGAGLVLLATGIKILASAMADIAQLSWGEIAKGLTGVGVGLGLMAASLALLPPSSILSAAAIFVVAASLSMVADAIGKMGQLSWGEIAKGMTTLGGALLLISAALIAMEGALPGAAAFAVAAVSLQLVVDALGKMAGMSWGDIAKGMVVLAGALTILALGMAAMTEGLPGAAAMIVAAGAIAILTPALVALGNLSWEQILKGLVALGAALAVLGIAAALLTPVIPSMLGLGIAIGLIGAGVALAGAGILALSIGLTAISVAGAAATTALVAMVSALLGMLPAIATALGQAIVALAVQIGQAAPAIIGALVNILVALLSAIIQLAPKIGAAATVLMLTFLKYLIIAIPSIAAAGARIIAGVIQGIASNIDRIVTAATNLVVNFINSIGKNLPRVIQAGVNLIVNFVNGIATAIRQNSTAMGQAGGNLATAIVEGMARGIAGGIGQVTDAAKRLAQNALDAAKHVLGIHSPSKEFEKLGKFSVDGFVKGLDGNKASIDASMKSMNDLIKSAMSNAADDIKKYHDRLEKLNKARKKDVQAIRETAAALAQARSEYAKASAAQKKMNTFKDEQKQLDALATKQDAINTKLAAANKQLEDAKKTRDDYNKSIKDQYSNIPDITAETKLPDYIASLEKQITDTQLFSSQLQKLREMGLDDTIYKDLLSKGTAAMPFVQQILEGGQTSVDQLNTLDSALQKSAASLGDTASKALYQAAVDSAAGLVKGLQDQQKNIEAQMDKIAAAMVKAIKKALGIKSPSKEFMKIGQWSSEGLAKGLEESTAPVDAAEKVGNNAILAMQKSLTGLSDLVNMEVDMNPVIKPVLDLTDVKKEADRLNGIITTKPIEVGGAYSSARSLIDEVNATQNARNAYDASQNVPGNQVVFIQNNNSPKALSEATIYRQTKNQISVAKGALANK